MKRIFSACLILVLCLGLAVGAGAITVISPSSDSYVTDAAGVITQETKDYIDSRDYQLEQATGGQIAVVTVDFISGYDIEDYAYALINEWGVGDAKKNNGTVILLVIGEENYWVTVGTGAEAFLSSYTLKTILNEYMEPSFAVGDYDSAVRLTVDAIIDKYADYYGVSLGQAQGGTSTPEPYYPAPSQDYDYYYYYDGYYESGSGFLGFIVTIIVLIAIYSLLRGLVLAARHSTRQPDGRYSYEGRFYRSLFTMALLNNLFSPWRYRRYGRWGAPPPPPPGGHRPPPPPPPGGHRPPNSSFNSRNRRPPGGFGGGGGFGGFGGGGFGGGGFGGGGFGGFGGGGGRGGGAGRR